MIIDHVMDIKTIQELKGNYYIQIPESRNKKTGPLF